MVNPESLHGKFSVIDPCTQTGTTDIKFEPNINAAQKIKKIKKENLTGKIFPQANPCLGMLKH